MRRRTFIASTVSVLAAPLAAEAQQAGKVPRLGLLHVLSARNWSSHLFLDELAKLGWVEGRTVVIEERFARRPPPRLTPNP
jgi:hypothetical protein